MGHYEAKFAREAKEHPADWAIRPCSRTGKLKLVYLGVSNGTANRNNSTNK